MKPAADAALKETIALIVRPSEAAHAAARERLNSLTKPLGSLGRLEDLAAQWAAIRQQKYAQPIRKAVYVFAADHGVTAEGVSAYPQEVTRQMVLNFMAGGAAISVLAKQNQCDLHVVDVGVDADLSSLTSVIHRKIARGTNNMLLGPAMSEDQLFAALNVGLDLADEAAAEGISLLAIGEMGIGNTTAATAMTCALTGIDPEFATGRGTGIDDARRSHKVAVIERILARHSVSHWSAVDILRTVGGLEIAAMAGMVLGAGRHGIAVLCDGFISTAAAAIAVLLEDSVHGYLIASHQSAEPGHRVLLEHLNLEPLLKLNMRLGEGSGAVLAMPIVEAAVALFLNMATFASAQVSESSS